MRQDWMIDVLVDLQSFARQNKLPHLQQQLALTAEVARQELGRRDEDASIRMRTVTIDAGAISGAVRSCSNA